MGVKPDRKPASPLPAALLTLAVVVCLGGVAQPGVPERAVQQQRRAVLADREGLGQLVAALTDAARKLGQQHETQPALYRFDGPTAAVVATTSQTLRPTPSDPRPAPLRAELTHLPPPALG